MTVESIILEKIRDNKECVSGWSINKILKYLDVTTVEEGIEKLSENIRNYNYSIPTHWHGITQFYYRVNGQNELFIADKRKDTETVICKFVHHIEFHSDEDKLRYMFEVAGGLMAVEKYEF